MHQGPGAVHEQQRGGVVDADGDGRPLVDDDGEGAEPHLQAGRGRQGRAAEGGGQVSLGGGFCLSCGGGEPSMTVTPLLATLCLLPPARPPTHPPPMRPTVIMGMSMRSGVERNAEKYERMTEPYIQRIRGLSPPAKMGLWLEKKTCRWEGARQAVLLSARYEQLEPWQH